MVIMIYIQEYKAITRHFCGIFFRENFLPVASGELCIRERNKTSWAMGYKV